jgi:biotin carboxylase
MSPTVLFVNTRPTPLEAEPCYRAAKALGLDVVLLADRPAPAAEGSWNELVEVDTFDVHALVAAARDVATRCDVRGVVCWGDRDVEGTAHVARALGLPGHSLEAAAAARNKILFRDRLADAAPDLSVRYARVDATREAVHEELEQLLPAIVKPAGASASKGILTARTAAELAEALERSARYVQPEVDPIFRWYPGQVIVEEFIEGSEHSIEGLVDDGRLVAAVITDKWIEPTYHREVLQLHPSALPAEQQEAAVDAARRAAEAIGLGTGAFHLELKMRPDGSMRLLELNARTGGAYITSHLLPLARGFDFIQATLRLACGLGGDVVVPGAHAVAGSRHVLASEAGRFDGVLGVDSALSTPGLLLFTLEQAIGGQVKVPPDGFVESVLASLVAVGYSHAAVTRALEDAEAKLRPAIASLAR